MINLSKRLLSIANVVSGNVIADVGCDHGKLAFYLLETKKCNFAYVSDISKPSLDKAISLLTSKNLSFRAICTNGLKDYNSIDNIDECVISGMGGFEIIKIISNSPININTYILSPQHNIIDVKKFMIENNYFITYDKVIKDENKFYNIIKCEKTNVAKKFNEFDLYFGKNNFEGSLSDFEDYLIYLKNKNIKLKNCVSEECKKEIEKILTYIQIAEERIGKNNE